MKNTEIKAELNVQEIQAILNTLGQMPTQYGAGLYSFFAKKAEVFQPKPQAKEETLKADEEHG